jgi:hypothetical protein
MLPDEIVHASFDEDPDVFMQQACGHGNFLQSIALEYQDPQEEESKAPVPATEKDIALQQSVESILLSIFDADETSVVLLKKDILRAKNRISAQQTRDADKLFMELMLLELKEALETFGQYTAYTTQLRMHASSSVEGLHEFEQRNSTHIANVALLHAYEFRDDTEIQSTQTVKERNRRHAQKSRMKRNKFIQDLTKERDEVVVTLEEVVKYTTALEGSCSFLELGVEINANLMKMRQKLFDRTCAHQDKHRQLKSHMTFRVAYRVNFR